MLHLPVASKVQNTDLEIKVSLVSGRCASFSLSAGAQVRQLKVAAQRTFEKAFLSLATADGVFLDPWRKEAVANCENEGKN